jgi:hypothetical protein
VVRRGEPRGLDRPRALTGRARLAARALGFVAVLVLVSYAARTFEQVDTAVSQPERDAARDLISSYRCLADRLAELPDGERYWVGDPSTDAAREIWRQRIVQLSFPSVQLADSEEDATVRLGLEPSKGAPDCGGFVLVTTPIEASG